MGIVKLSDFPVFPGIAFSDGIRTDENPLAIYRVYSIV